MFEAVLTSLPMVLAISVLLVVILYWWGGRISAKGEPSTGKLIPYACGEEPPVGETQSSVQKFFIYAVYFMVFDILAFMLATSLGSPGLIAATYAIVILLAIVMLLPLLGRG